MAIETELERLLDEADANERAAQQRENHSRGVFRAHRKRKLADPSLHPLAKVRLTFRGEGLTRAQLSERSTVAESVIKAIESGDSASDVTWIRLVRALNETERSVTRKMIDPEFNTASSL